MELKDPGPIEFEAVIQTETKVPNASAWVDFPYNLKETFGKGNLVPIKATFDGRVPYQGSLAMMSGDCAMLLLRKDVRAELGKQAGDKVKVEVRLDKQKREIILAPDVKKALIRAGLLEKFQKLAFSHQREYIHHIEEAKRSETRINRIEKTVTSLLEKSH